MVALPGPGDAARADRPFRASPHVAASILLIAVATLLPVDGTVTWLHPIFVTSPGDLVTGVWLLKVLLGTVAIAIPGVEWMKRSAPPVAIAEPVAVWRRTDTFMVAGIAVVALVLRLYRLDAELWLDEIETLVRYVPLEFRQLASVYDGQNHHPLYSMLARPAFLLTGGADWSIRLPAVLFGAASIVVLREFAATLTSRAEANLAAVTMAVSYHHVWFSQNARGYTAILLLAIASSWIFLRLAEARGHRPSRLAWTYAVLMSLAAYTHLTATLIAVGHAGALLLTTPWRRPDARRAAIWPVAALCLSALLTLTLYALMLPQVLREVAGPTMGGVDVEWANPRWMATEGARVLARGVPGGLLTVAVILGVLGVGIRSYWRQSSRATLVMFLPVAVTAAVMIGVGHNLWPRFFFFAAGFLLMVALRGGFVLVRRLIPWRPGPVAVAGASSVALLSLFTLPRAWQPKQQFRAAHAFVEQQRAPGDVVVELDVVRNVSLMRGWPLTWHVTRGALALREAERAGARTWVVYTLPTRLRVLSPDLWDLLQPPRYQVERVFPSTVGGGEITVLRRTPDPRND